ncbi:sulfatase family protein [Paenibacillus cymbidii]|uniref:sulfatase family protein n=1 Tax=Paenibacillus cymbidii TaxID=1639034 RepID=UPI00108072D5|nr:sulfatase-like hydrolase/transferase [Paenibacillus cymbidii]
MAHQGEAAAVEAARAVDKPNILFITSDHHRWDYMGNAGSAAVGTPNLDRLAARGTRIGRMYCNAPLCVPSRIAMTSGRYASNTGCFTNRQPVDPGIPTFLHSLRAGGYHTAMIGKLHHHVHVWDGDFVGHEEDVHRLGFEYAYETSGKMGSGSIGCECRYVRFLRERGLLAEYRAWTGRFRQGNAGMKPHEPWPWDAELTQDAHIAEQACRFLRQTPREKPFYLHLGFVGPHDPYDAPAVYRQRYEEADVPPGVDRAKWIAYAACITEVDDRIGRVLAVLEEMGMTENTVVLYTSDHGDNAGDHGLWGKINLYEGSVHVPFLAAGPGIRAGAAVDAVAELLDIGRTACDYAGVASHAFDQGRSLKPVLTGTAAAHREDAYCEMGSDKMLFDGRYKLMYGNLTKDTRTAWQAAPYHGPAFGRPVTLPPDRISLYDLRDDPGETTDLADDPAYAGLLQEMKEKLLQRLIRNMQAVPDDPGSVL